MKRIEMYNRSSFIMHNSKMILKFDLSKIYEDDDVVKLIDYFYSIVINMPKRSILGFIDFTDLEVTDNTLNEIIKLYDRCNVYFIATSCIASDHDTLKLANSIIAHYGEINLKITANRQEAQEWLTTMENNVYDLKQTGT